MGDRYKKYVDKYVDKRAIKMPIKIGSGVGCGVSDSMNSMAGRKFREIITDITKTEHLALLSIPLLSLIHVNSPWRKPEG